jgi:YVTN family beta-propeller protein
LTRSAGISRSVALLVAVTLVAGMSACTSHNEDAASVTVASPAKSAAKPSSPARTGSVSTTSAPRAASTLLPGMPAPLVANDVYAADRPNQLSDVVRSHRALVYVPNSNSGTVTVIDQQTMNIIDTFPAGNEPQHVVPSYDLKTLYAIADVAPGNGFTVIDPTTGKVVRHLPIADPYNLYFSPDGKYGIVVAEYYKRLDFYDPHTWQLMDSRTFPNCAGIDHIDFSADGRTMVASCEFANQLVVIDVATHALVRVLHLPRRSDGMPQDVKLSPDGKVFYVADMMAGGVYLIDGAGQGVIDFIPTGAGTHGLYVDRTSTRLFITNRGEGSITVLDLRSRKPLTKWWIPGGGSPDMGNLSADGKVFWVSGRYHGVVYAISTDDGHLIKKIRVQSGPHGLCVWPQPGRYSLGHTGILR